MALLGRTGANRRCQLSEVNLVIQEQVARMAEERAQRRLAAVLAADAIRWAQRLSTMNTSSYGRVFVWPCSEATFSVIE